MQKTNIAILGATGMVGQRFVEMLSNHPYFRIAALLASEGSAGKPYSQAANWLISQEMPRSVKSMIVKKTWPEFIANDDIEIVFSALPSNIARNAEPQFAKAGFKVFSNASAFRWDDDVPLVVAEINAPHMDLVKIQQKQRNWQGFIITNPNCSTIIMALVLKPLYDAFGIKQVIASTMQAVSGAGYPGVASLDIVDNVLPYIAGEEEKVEKETVKILGTHNMEHGTVQNTDIKISASCQRVCTVDGHLLDLHISLGRAARVDEIKKVLYDFGSKKLNLPTAPAKTLIITDDLLRPQPKLDRNAGGGMSITIGRIRQDPVLENGVKMTILGHNTIRGAAGQSILNAEWWKEKNKV